MKDLLLYYASTCLLPALIFVTGAFIVFASVIWMLAR